MRFDEIPHNLVERARDGHADALEEFCMMIQPSAYAVLLSLLRNREDALDVLQDSLIRVIRFLPKLRDSQAFPGWVMRILVTQAASSYKVRSGPVVDVYAMDENLASESVNSTSSEPLSPRRAAENREVRNCINDAVLDLTERQRTALVLFEMENLSILEVAQAMEISAGAVKFHLHEARLNMRKALQARGIQNAVLSEEGSA